VTFRLTARTLATAHSRAYRHEAATIANGYNTSATPDEIFSSMSADGLLNDLDEDDELTDSQWRKFTAACRKGRRDAR